MKLSTQFLVAAGLLSLSGLAHAEGAGSAASLTFNFSALKYSNVSTKSKADAAGSKEVTVKDGALATSNLQDSYAQITHGNFNFYCSPFNATHTVQASYMVVPDFVEVGLNLGLNTDSVDTPKHTSNDTTVGLFAWVYPKVGSMTSELGLELDSIAAKSQSDEKDAAGNTVKSKTDQSAFKALLSANLVVPLAKNFNYVAGLYYANTNTTVKEATATSAKGKSQVGEFGVNIASFRVTVE